MTPTARKPKVPGEDSFSKNVTPRTRRAASRHDNEVENTTLLTPTHAESDRTDRSRKSDGEKSKGSSKNKASKEKSSRLNEAMHADEAVRRYEVVGSVVMDTPLASSFEKESKNSSRRKQKNTSIVKEGASTPPVEFTDPNSTKNSFKSMEKQPRCEQEDGPVNIATLVTPKVTANGNESISSSKKINDVATPQAEATELKTSKKSSSKKKKTLRCEPEQKDGPIEIDLQASNEVESMEEEKISSKKKRKQVEASTVEQNPLPVVPTKSAPTVDVMVHRIRHLAYRPKPIHCIASIVTAQMESWMAVSRESGSIELQTVNPKLRTIAVIAGSADTPLTVLAWTQVSLNSVLVGANRDDLYVVDFWGRSQLVAKTPCAGGGIFCLQSIGSDFVAAGCQDGSIRIFRVEADDGGHRPYQLQVVSTVPSAGSAVLSLACRPRIDAESSGLVGTILFAGIADGTIRRYDCCSTYQNVKSTSAAALNFFASAGVSWKSTLRMTVECYGRSTPTRVWTLKVASDCTVVSGDSLGHVQFWDGETGTLVSSFEQNDNKADVLDMDMTADECKVFASGVDSRVICIERSTGDASDETKWIMTHAQRPHTHDVKAVTIVKKLIVIANGTSKYTEILCTGGIDTKLCTYHVSDFGIKRPRTFYPWPSLKSPVAVANEGRLLAMLREDRVDIFKLAVTSKGPKPMMAPVLVPEEDLLIGTVQVKGSSNLACSAISNSGEFLALSDSYSLLLFHLRSEKAPEGIRKVVPCKVPITIPRQSSIVAMRFVQDRCLVIVTSGGCMYVISLSPSVELAMEVDGESGFQADVVQTVTLPAKIIDDQASLLPVHSVFGSGNGTWFATARNSSGHHDGKIDIYCKTSDDDMYQFWWSLPSLGTAVTASAFLEHENAPLLSVGCVNYELYIFDVSRRCLSKWSERAGYPVAEKFLTDLTARSDYPIRIGTNPAAPALVMMVSTCLTGNLVGDLRGIYCRTSCVFVALQLVTPATILSLPSFAHLNVIS